MAAATPRIYLEPSNSIFSMNVAAVGITFNISVLVADAPDIAGAEVSMEFNDSVVNVVRRFDPTWNTSYIFYGMPSTSIPTPPSPGYVHLGPSVGRIMVAVSKGGMPPTPPWGHSGLICILELSIIAVPSDTSVKLTSDLAIDSGETFLLDPSAKVISGVIKENGYYEVSIQAAAQVTNMIVTTSDLEAAATRLAQWKNSCGIISNVLDLTWIDSRYSGVDEPEKIRNCIRAFHNSFRTKYVTILGDTDKVPIRYCYVPDTVETTVPTDLYYADLDYTWDDNHDGRYGDLGNDTVEGIPDVCVGRIPASFSNTAEDVLTKIIEYQQGFNSSEDWVKRVVLAAGDPMGNGNATTDISDYISGVVRDKSIVKLYWSGGNLSTVSLASEIDRGCLFLNFAGHSGEGLIQDLLGIYPAAWILGPHPWNPLDYEKFTYQDALDRSNGEKLPVVVTMSCLSAKVDWSGLFGGECLGEYFVMSPNGGAIAYFGSTGIAWCPSVDAPYWLMGDVNRRVYEAFYEGHTRLGDMWAIALDEYLKQPYHQLNYYYQGKGYLNEKTVMEFILLGDPTLRIYNPDFPETLRVPEDFPTIQSAINAAYDGDTVNVSSGIYYENVVVNKSLSLIGQERGSTIIDGNSIGNVVNITACNVNVSCFTIRNSGKTWTDVGTGIYVSGAIACCNVSGNIITSNGYGIRIDSPPNNTIDGNSITDNWYGITLSGSSNNSIVRNNVTNDFYGIALGMSSSMNMLRNNQMACYSENFECFNNWGLSSYANDIDPSNTVDGKPIYYWINKSNETVPVDAGYVALINCTHIAVHDLSLSRNGQGVLLAYTEDSTITKNNMTSNFLGIDADCSSNNTLSENVVDANIDGIVLTYSSNNTIVRNSLNSNSQTGIWIFDSSGNHIYHNSFLNNNAGTTYSYNSTNIWDDGYPSGGNYLSDYNGTDLYGGPYQNQTDSDGIGDTPYTIDANNQDNYPLMNPYPAHDLALASLTSAPTVICQGYRCLITVKVTNKGDLTETFNITVYANMTDTGNVTLTRTFENVILSSRDSRTLTFMWNTSGFDIGDYTISAYAWPVPGETDIADNTFVDGVVQIVQATNGGGGGRMPYMD
jgi:parallel beta-helix repeat protein